MHKEEADERSGRCDVGLRNGDFSANDKVVKKVKGFTVVCYVHVCAAMTSSSLTIQVYILIL